MAGDEMESTMRRLGKALSKLWEYCRELSGENQYARYRARVSKAGARVMTREQFYLGQLERKYSSPSRCC